MKAAYLPSVQAFLPVGVVCLLACSGAQRVSPAAAVPGDPCEQMQLQPGTKLGYMLGWGRGGDATSADDAARAEIAKVFSVTVSGETKTKTAIVRSDNVDNVTQATRVAQTATANSSTTLTIEGIEILGRHSLPGAHCTLAGLQRDTFAASKEAQVEKFEARAEQAYRSARETSDPIASLKQLADSEMALAEAMSYRSQMALVGRERIEPPNVSLSQLEEQRSEAQRGLTVKVDGKDAGPFLDAVEAILTNAGFTPSRSGVLSVTVAVDYSVAGQDSFGFTHGQASMRISLRNTEGMSLESLELSARASSTDAQNAKRMTLDKLSASIDSNAASFAESFAKTAHL